MTSPTAVKSHEEKKCQTTAQSTPYKPPELNPTKAPWEKRRYQSVLQAQFLHLREASKQVKQAVRASISAPSGTESKMRRAIGFLDKAIIPLGGVLPTPKANIESISETKFQFDSIEKELIDLKQTVLHSFKPDQKDTREMQSFSKAASEEKKSSARDETQETDFLERSGMQKRFEQVRTQTREWQGKLSELSNSLFGQEQAYRDHVDPLKKEVALLQDEIIEADTYQFPTETIKDTKLLGSFAFTFRNLMLSDQVEAALLKQRQEFSGHCKTHEALLTLWCNLSGVAAKASSFDFQLSQLISLFPIIKPKTIFQEVFVPETVSIRGQAEKVKMNISEKVNPELNRVVKEFAETKGTYDKFKKQFTLTRAQEAFEKVIKAFIEELAKQMPETLKTFVGDAARYKLTAEASKNSKLQTEIESNNNQTWAGIKDSLTTCLAQTVEYWNSLCMNELLIEDSLEQTCAILQLFPHLQDLELSFTTLAGDLRSTRKSISARGDHQRMYSKSSEKAALLDQMLNAADAITSLDAISGQQLGQCSKRKYESICSLLQKPMPEKTEEYLKSKGFVWQDQSTKLALIDKVTETHNTISQMRKALLTKLDEKYKALNDAYATASYELNWMGSVLSNSSYISLSDFRQAYGTKFVNSLSGSLSGVGKSLMGWFSGSSSTSAPKELTVAALTTPGASTAAQKTGQASGVPASGSSAALGSPRSVSTGVRSGSPNAGTASASATASVPASGAASASAPASTPGPAPAKSSSPAPSTGSSTAVVVLSAGFNT